MFVFQRKNEIKIHSSFRIRLTLIEFISKDVDVQIITCREKGSTFQAYDKDGPLLLWIQ